VSAVQAQLELQLIERLKLKQQQQVHAARKLEEAVAMRQSVRCVYIRAALVVATICYAVHAEELVGRAFL
jgi:hypothetical protein